VLVHLGKTYCTSALPSLWLYALGAIFIFVTLLLPRGIVGLFASRERVAVSEPVASRAEAREAAG
jgi:urea transport system permease protein